MIGDIKKLNRYYKIYRFISKASDNEKLHYLEFRAKFIQEELTELFEAINGEEPDEVVDAFIDIIVIALGSLDAFDVDIKTAWKRVHYANMQKEIGLKDSRPNPLGLPDLVKPKGWQAPQHFDNVGKLDFLNKE
jgi:predicted HAD superfamily Cof-like phosphohydrolase